MALRRCENISVRACTDFPLRPLRMLHESQGDHAAAGSGMVVWNSRKCENISVHRLAPAAHAAAARIESQGQGDHAAAGSELKSVAKNRAAA